MLKIFNTLSKQKEEFNPLEAGKVGIYACGITVYDLCHIGHARTFIVFDIVVKYLEYLGYEVKFVRNITDIDDKIINRANELGIPYTELTAKTIQAMHDDCTALQLKSPDSEPRATEYIQQMISLVEKLISKGFAYQGENGDVYYKVREFANYGQLSKRNLEDMVSGSRVEVAQAKCDPLDFVLWKRAKEGEPSWPSPWGLGRPGWHLECSAMSMDILGETFDIHGGGFDLTFPHHENECAQSEAASGKPLANYWMHVGFLQINREKMSKSLGNFATIREVLAEVPVEVLRYFMISGHYRKPLDYSLENIKLSKGALQRLYTALSGVELSSVDIPHDHPFIEQFTAAMNDDFNTPAALSVLFELAKELNKAKESNNSHNAQLLGVVLRYLGNILGLLLMSPDEFLRMQTRETPSISDAEIDEMLLEREKARGARDFARADQIRDTLASYGVVLEDSPKGTTWRRE